MYIEKRSNKWQRHIYSNDLIDVLRSSNIGGIYVNHYMGVLCYALASKFVRIE